MQRLPLLCAVCVLLMAAAMAQEIPRAEMFGGYQYGNLAATPTALGGLVGIQRASLNGWNASGTVNVNRWLGGVADFGGIYGSPTAGAPFACPVNNPGCGTFKFVTHDLTFLFGPQLSYRRTKVTPFAHALFGAARITGHAQDASISGTNTSFAMAVGGGMDYNLTLRFAVRAQSDYLRTSFLNTTQNNLRVATGFVVRF